MTYKKNKRGVSLRLRSTFAFMCWVLNIPFIPFENLIVTDSFTAKQPNLYLNSLQYISIETSLNTQCRELYLAQSNQNSQWNFTTDKVE